MKPLKPDALKQVEFIKDCLRKGQSRKDILQPFTNLYKTGIKTFDNRLKLAQKAIQDEQGAIKEKADKLVDKEVDALKSKIIAPTERMAILGEQAQSLIDKVSGKVEFNFVVGNSIKRSHSNGVFMCPIEAQIKMLDTAKSLIAELNKMGGDYAPTRTDITSNGKTIQLPSWIEADKKESILASKN